MKNNDNLKKNLYKIKRVRKPKTIMKFKNRNFVSILIVFGFLAISITGVCYFIGVKSNIIEVVHVLFGLLFVVLIGFHIFYNFTSLKNYSVNRKVKSIRKELIIGTSISLVLLAIMCFNLDFSFDLANSGKNLLSSGRKNNDRQKDALIFNEIATNEEVKGTSLKFIIWLNDDVVAPTVVIWGYDVQSKINENLFLPAKRVEIPPSINHIEDFQKPETEKLITYDSFDSSQMPLFSKSNINLIPNFERATPFGNFILETNIKAKGNFIIFIEINYNGEIELYQTNIDKTTNTIFQLKSPKNQFIRKAIVIIN
jgi:hypothetical protein